VTLALAALLLVLAVVGHGLAVTLPKLMWTQLHTVWRSFGRAAPTPPDPHGEPAVPVYAGVTAARDLRAAWWDGLERHERLMGDAERFMADRVDDVLRRSRGTGRGLLMAFLRPAFLLTAVAVVLVATALSIVPLLAALLVWAPCCALWTLWWALWAAVARVGRVGSRGGPVPCPYTTCGRAVRRPVRLCPACRARHRRLLPGRYGALHRRCRCGTRLPVVLGVRRLEACCPHCDRTLPAGYERARVVVLVGHPAERRGAVHRRVLTGLGLTAGAEPALLRAGGAPVLWFDPPGDAYAGQDAVSALDVVRGAHGLLLVVDDPAAHSAAVRAVTRVLHVLATLPARRRPQRLAVLYTGAAHGDDTTVRERLTADGGGHLLRALDATGARVRCVAAASPERSLWWLAGTEAPAGRGGLLPPPPDRRPRETPPRHPRHRAARRTLLLGHLAGYLVVPLVLVLLEAGVLPPGSLLGLPGAYDKWRRPLAGSVRQVDLAAAATRDWPRLRAGYWAPGHPPSDVLPGHPGYWSIAGSPDKDNWLRVDFGLALPLSEVSVVFDPDSVEGVFSPGAQVEGQVGSRTVRIPTGDMRQEEGSGFLKKTYGYDNPVPEAVDSLRIGLGSILDKDDDVRRLRLEEFNFRWRSSDALRLRPADGGRLTIENTTARDLAVTVRPPLLPRGWRAAPVGRPPRTLGAHDSYEVRWRITAPQGATGRAPVVHTVDISEDGRTVTARCLALLTASQDTEPLC
jgi:hypothetical protein